MNRPPLLCARLLTVGSIATATILLGLGCENLHGRGKTGTFASVRPLLEANCVHCHGANRLAHMPAFGNSRELAALIGPAAWIVPGRPERSPFFRAVVVPDAQAGAMPPTGHAISTSDVELLRAWITAGAPVPKDPAVIFLPRGDPPRSR